MKKTILITVVLTIMTVFFGVCSHAAIEDCDFSDPKDGYIDGGDLAQFAAYYAVGDPAANVDGVGDVDSDDVAHFAGFYGGTYAISARRPNILLIIADDIGIDVTTDMYPGLITDLLALYGPEGHDNPNYLNIDGNPASTPVLNGLAQEGMRFSSASAQPVCSPTRAAIITGLFADKTGVASPGNPLSQNHATFVQRMKDDANYSTAMFGKWHLGTNSNGTLPKRAGFDLFRGNVQGAISPTFWSYGYHVQDDATTNPDQYRTDSTPSKSLPGIASTTFAPVVKVADTIEWIEARQAEDPDKPWFAWLAFNEAHSPMHVPNADTLNALSLAEVTGCGGVPGTTTRGSCTNKVLTRAMTNAMDTVIGKLLDAVASIPSDTYVIFVGDNGTDVSTTNPNSLDNMYIDTSINGKGSVYESGSRVALVVRGLGIAAGSASSEYVHVTDLYNTCLNLAGLPSETQNQDSSNQTVDSDSVSFTPILFGDATAVRDPNEGYILVETSYGGNKVGARNARYKVVCSGSASNCEFYDLVGGPLGVPLGDPLEVYPLSEPGSCTNYRTMYTTGDAGWHYCRLTEVVDMYSIF
jgi:arylsulfatase A-like enzyme